MQSRSHSSTTAVIKVSDVMTTDVVRAEMDETLDVAVHRMVESDVGCIIVTDGGAVAGIITKGDVLRKAFLKGVEARQVIAKDIMTKPAVTISPDATLEEASRLLSKKHVSKLPVEREGRLVGIITSTDIIRTEPTQVGYLQELVRARFVPHDLR
jgi:CBS domain-containing protein